MAEPGRFVFSAASDDLLHPESNMRPETATLADYLDMFRRRKAPMLLVAIVLSILGFTVALALPPVYRSTATIKIEQQGIPDDIVRSTVNTYADTQIQNVKQRVVTSSKLAQLITDLGLATQLGPADSTEILAGEMIPSVFVEPVGAEVVDPRTGKPRTATIAFTVSYESDEPHVAKKVANALADLFLKENAASRAESAADTAGFIAEQAEKWKQEIAEMESRIAVFKVDNAGRLPELSDVNLRLMENTERDLRDNQERIRSLQQQRIYLEGELAQLKPYAPSIGTDGNPILSPVERLDVLQNEYASKLAIYSSEHPDVVRLGKEIASLKPQTRMSVDQRTALETELSGARAQLAIVLQRYSPEHPDVRKLKRTIDNLEHQVRTTRKPVALPQQALRKPDNPAYIELQARLGGVAADLRTLAATEVQLREKLSEYENRLTDTPQVERQYQAMQREHEVAVNEYNKIKAKQREAELAEQLEVRSKGERYSLVSAAALPDSAYKPKRGLIALFGVVIAFAGGVGTAVLTEALDRTVRGAKALLTLLNAPVLGVIPYIDNQSDRNRRRRRRLVYALTAVVAIMTGGLAINMQFSSFGALWSTVLDRFGYKLDEIQR